MSAERNNPDFRSAKLKGPLRNYMSISLAAESAVARRDLLIAPLALRNRAVFRVVTPHCLLPIKLHSPTANRIEPHLTGLLE